MQYVDYFFFSIFWQSLKWVPNGDLKSWHKAIFPSWFFYILYWAQLNWREQFCILQLKRAEDTKCRSFWERTWSLSPCRIWICLLLASSSPQWDSKSLRFFILLSSQQGNQVKHHFKTNKKPHTGKEFEDSLTPIQKNNFKNYLCLDMIWSFWTDFGCL